MTDCGDGFTRCHSHVGLAFGQAWRAVLLSHCGACYSLNFGQRPGNVWGSGVDVVVLL